MELQRLPFGQSLSDKLRAAHYKWVNTPPGLTPELASKLMRGLHGGETIRDLTNTGELYICSFDRFKKQCEMHPEWGVEARRLSRLNSNKKKSANHATRGKRFEFCRSGRHRMEGDNVIQGRRPTNRFCRTCRHEKLTRPMTCQEVEAVKYAVSVERRTINNITTGAPIGGGKPNYKMAIVYRGPLYAQFKRDPTFYSFVQQHIAGNTARGQIIRYTKIRTATTRDNNNEYYKIRNMIPEQNPHRDDIVARIFEDLLGGSLKRDDVPARVKVYISEMNRLFPTKYAKFGDSPLVSLDEALFDDGSATRGDNVSRGLWD